MPLEKEVVVRLFDGKQDEISMYDLYFAARKKGLSAVGKRIDYKGLLNLNTPAIAFVQRNHFVVVDRAIGNKIRIIDPPQLPTLMTQEQFESIWHGEVLVVSNPQKEKREYKLIARNAPDIEFEELAYDFGTLEQEQEVSHIFRFTNQGDKELEISRVRSSCGCAAALLTKNKLAPGETGKIKVSYTTGLRQGVETHTIIVSSNDPDEPHIYLTIAGKIKSNIAIFPSQLYFGDFFQRETVQKKLYLVNPEEQSVKITKLSATSPFISAAIETTNLKETAISVFIKPGLPLGKFTDKLTISTNYRKKPRITVPIEGDIIGDIVAVPAKFFFGLTKKGEELTRKVSLTSEGRTKFRIQKVTTELDSVLASVGKVETNILKEQELYELSLTLKPKIKSGRIQGKVLVYTDNAVQPVIEIPIYALVLEGLPVASTSGIIPTVNMRKTIQPIELMFFYAANCPECPEVKDEFLPKLKEKYGELIELKSYDIGDMKNYELLIQYEEKYKDASNVSM
ncbi:MAG: DUF1573 domain-containing protein, partial [bacterium]|nr:DUF1573 domain-containing protein [bacterium]